MGQVLQLAGCRLSYPKSMLMKTISVLSLLIVVFTLGIISCKEKRKRPGDEYVRVPSLELVKMDSSGIIRTDSIPKDKPIVFMFFQSDCSHCQDEMTSITENAPLIRDWQILLVSRQPLDSIRSFSYRNNLHEFRNITVCKDTGMMFFKVFQMQSIPSSVIYDANGDLRVRYDGAIDVFKMKKYIDTKGL